MEVLPTDYNTERIKSFLTSQGWSYALENASYKKGVKLIIVKEGTKRLFYENSIKRCFAKARIYVLSKHIEVCYLCGNNLNGKIDRDHVPPRQFYPSELMAKSNLSNIFTLPTHRNCNKSYQSDEDYFTTAFGSISLSSEYGAMKFEDIINTTQYETGAKLFNMVRKGITDRIGNIYLPPNQSAMEFDGERIRRIIWKITRGLFFKEHGRILPENIKYLISISYGNKQLPDEFHLVNSGSRGLHPKVFDYAFFENDQIKDFHIWAFIFWGIVVAVISFFDPEYKLVLK